MKYLPAVLALGLVLPAAPQSARAPRDASRFFNPADLMTIGVYYYPEAWPSSQWARDMANIRKLDMEFVHMGEFAWAFLEPAEGKYDLAWLEKNVELARQNGLKVVLCTPSATPPIWLSRGHPDILMVDADGRRMNHGSREHACWSSPVYREYVRKINTELARRFGQHPAVIGWQIDNELSHYGKRYCYCNNCRSKFRGWLRTKYKTIDALNRDWGNAFWSQMYQNFDQIDIPNQRELAGGANPHALLDFQRWFADEAADYLRFQADTLRAYSKDQWVTTNFMNMHGEVDPARSRTDLDAFTWTIYPVRGQAEGQVQWRLGDPFEMSFMHDLMRPLNGVEGLMELQPGQVNWAQVNPWPQPGAIHMWLMRSFAAGAKIMCTYRYRQPLYGDELYHSGLVLTDGVTPSPGGLEFSQAMRDVLALRKQYRPDAQPPREYAARRTALLFSHENRWDIENHRQTTRFDVMQHVAKYYRGLKSLGAPVDVVGEWAELAKYPFVVAPAYQMVDRALIARLRSYAENGGHLVLSCRTGHKDRRGHLWEALWAEPIYELIGARIPQYDLLPGNITGEVHGLGAFKWASWGERLEPLAGTETLFTYIDQMFNGKAAVVTRKLGKGSVTYAGVDSVDGGVERAVLERVFRSAGVAALSLPANLLVDWRDGFWVATNYSDARQRIPAGEGARILSGKRELVPGGVAVWVE